MFFYHITKKMFCCRKAPTWWKRQKTADYFPIFEKNQASLVDYLKAFKIVDLKENIEADNKLVHDWFKSALDGLRNTLGQVDPVLLSWTVFTAYIILTATSTFTSSTGGHKKKA